MMLFVAMVSCASCAGGAKTGGLPSDARSIEFLARVGVDPFSCSSLSKNIGTTGASVEPIDFRLYIHDVRLIRDDGSEVAFALSDDGKWQYRNVALLDFEDKTEGCVNGTAETRTKIVGTAGDGKFNGIAFKIGVPSDLNHSDVATAPSPLNLSGLFWNWLDGRKFARIDGRVIGVDDRVSPFVVHIASTECVRDDRGATSCAKPNIGEVRLVGFDPFAKPIIADYKELLADVDVTRDSAVKGCMSAESEPDCDSIMLRLGIDRKTGQPNATTQRFFRVE